MLGKLIQTFRKQEDIGVLEFADKLGISRISLFRIEKGQREPAEHTAIKAFQILGLPEAAIYRIFVLNELHKHGRLSPSSENKDTLLLLRQLNKKDKHSKLIYTYFMEELHGRNKNNRK